MSEELARVRVDKWLWAARFFKTRALAVEAINGGHVHVNGTRVKAARTLQAGDEVRVRKGPYEFVVAVRGLSTRRGPAPEARRLYEETEASSRAREALAEQRRLEAAGDMAPSRRPDKKERRHIIRFTGKG